MFNEFLPDLVVSWLNPESIKFNRREKPDFLSETRFISECSHAERNIFAHPYQQIHPTEIQD